ncbi:hypothetical protein [Flavobacterium sp. ABG]|uniref:hypothetical protein n=1 Tax=Flavobacterium sp. ABG TaxID=1423322 RepID=UPI00064A2E64|nr:hypothetical protein [Flavobacterium sp. ABG]KLT70876.1 hypothetical protein AB674_03525 [Flavobacterium sp. ABG]
MKQSLPTIALIFLIGFAGHSQITQKIGDNPTTLNPSAVFETESTTKGFLPPRMTTVQRNAIATPPAGLMVYNTTTNILQVYNGVAWLECNLPKEYLEIPINGSITASGTKSQTFSNVYCNNCNATVLLPYYAANGLEHTIYNYGDGTITIKMPTQKIGDPNTGFSAHSGKDLPTTPQFTIQANRFVKVEFVNINSSAKYFKGVWLIYD